MLKYFSLPIGILIILSAACSRKYNPANTPFAIYHPISEDNVRKLEKGITTPADVVKLFGDPAKNSISDKGERYVYGYLGDTLTVNFDSSKTVGSFLYRPEIFTPVSGNPDNITKRIKESRVKKIEVYNTSKFTLEKWFGPANKKETGTNRNRYTFDRRNGTLVVYTLANYEERVLSYSFEPKH
ncbi:MAG: hypothetical protein J0H29_08420 [Sphingobacteriales bacterium]|nr:hypothetical protein [Sphingobacteriales bacterium]OJY81863.1 MAG: hypothetical protein BGP14_03640 [Sphingobacteriales bacterium 44-15]